MDNHKILRELLINKILISKLNVKQTKAKLFKMSDENLVNTLFINS